MIPSKGAVSVIDFIPYIKRQLLWVILIIAPFIVSFCFWGAMVVPSVKKLHRLQDIDVLVRLKPELESLLHEGDELLARWEAKGLEEQTTSAAFKEIQKLAQDSHIQIKEARVENSTQETVASFNKTAAAFQVVGTFARVAHWIHAIENNSSFQIDSWSLNPAPAGNNVNNVNLGITINVLLRNQ